MSNGMTGLDCHLELNGDSARVRPVGELDIATVGVVEQRIEEAITGGARRLVLDLSGLTFMASTGLRLVMSLIRRSNTGALELAVVPGPRAVHRVFELSGVDADVPWVDN